MLNKYQGIMIWILAFIGTFFIWGLNLLEGKLYFPFIVVTMGGSAILLERGILRVHNGLSNIQFGENEIKEKYVPFKAALLVGLCSMLYLLAFNPANMFTDTYFQFTQIKGTLPYGDWHSFGHTLFMKLILDITGSERAIARIQILAMTYICYLIFKEFYENGVGKKGLYIFALLFSGNIAFGITIVNIWKDTIYTIMMVWVIFFLYKFIRVCTKRECVIPHKMIGIIGLSGMLLFRHNGFIAVISIGIFMLFYYRSLGQVLKIFIPVALIYGIIMGPVFNAYNVEPNAKVTSYLPMLHGMAAVVVEEGWEELDEEAQLLMGDLLTEEEWITHYEPHNGDLYLFSTNDKLKKRCEKYSTVDVLVPYLRTFLKHPFIVMRDRLYGSELLWNLWPSSDSYNYITGTEIDNSNISMDTRLSYFGIEQKRNFLTDIVEQIFYSVEADNILNILLFRPAWILFCLCVIVLYAILNKNRVAWIVLPVYANVVSLLIAMTHQSFRYIWFLFIAAPIVMGLILVGSGGNKADGS